MFIVLEGIDAAGKTTHVNYIVEQLRNVYNKDVVQTREPGGTETAEKIRGVLLSPTEENIHADAEILMFYAARKLHIENKIKPAIEQGSIVVSDRFADSTFAYQCAHGADYDRIKQIHKWTLGDFKPDYVFYFFVSPEVAKDRINKRNKVTGLEDRFDNEAMDNNDFIERTMRVFMRRISENTISKDSNGTKYIFIDSSRDIEYAQNQIDQILKDIFSE